MDILKSKIRTWRPGGGNAVFRKSKSLQPNQQHKLNNFGDDAAAATTVAGGDVDVSAPAAAAVPMMTSSSSSSMSSSMGAGGGRARSSCTMPAGTNGPVSFLDEPNMQVRQDIPFYRRKISLKSFPPIS